jgi:hypothetical protein
MSEADESGTRHGKRRRRGIFERPQASGVWWVRYHDQHGREHREKVGPKGLALKVYHKRKNEIAEHRFFPERQADRTIVRRVVMTRPGSVIRKEETTTHPDALGKTLGGTRAHALNATGGSGDQLPPVRPLVKKRLGRYMHVRRSPGYLGSLDAGTRISDISRSSLRAIHGGGATRAPRGRRQHQGDDRESPET